MLYKIDDDYWRNFGISLEIKLKFDVVIIEKGVIL